MLIARTIRFVLTLNLVYLMWMGHTWAIKVLVTLGVLAWEVMAMEVREK